VVREVGITVWRMVELPRGNVMPAGRGGKLKTVAQAVAISFALAPLWTIVGNGVFWLNWVLMGIALVLTVWSGLDYLWEAYRLRRAERGRA
jgi:CDP-diacylglycerol--glycerol-3-phosphate 3-phosphatidyltransferase